MNMAPAPEHLVFVSVALELSYFMAPVPAAASGRFYTFLF